MCYIEHSNLKYAPLIFSAKGWLYQICLLILCFILQEQNRLKLPPAAASVPLAQREVAEPTDEEFRSAFNIMPRILQLLTSASHGQMHPQNVDHQ